MTSRSIQTMSIALVYCLLAGGIIWQTAALVGGLKNGSVGFTPSKYNTVQIRGNVERPGFYRVPDGTTGFEILKVAGIRPTSDVARLDIMEQVVNEQAIAVDTLAQPVTVTKEKESARLDFFIGELNIIDADGRNRPQQEGIGLNAGDRLLTEAQSQVELSIGAASRVDMHDFSELAFDRIGVMENDKVTTSLSQKSGICWYKMIYPSKSHLYQIQLPLVRLTVAGSGADCIVDIRQDQIVIHNIDGLLLIERPQGTESINLISGQSVVIRADPGRPFEVTGLAADVNPKQTFAPLVKEKTNYMLRHMPLNMLVCGTPNIYYLVSIRFEQGIIYVVQIPAETLVDQFVQGFSTIHEGFLYGGPVLCGSLLERIFDTPISKYFVITVEDMLRIAFTMGGVTVTLDDKSAASMNMKKGKQKITSEQMFEYIKPSLSGVADAQTRQIEVLKALVEGFRTKNVVLTAMLAQQLLANLETNMLPPEVMDQYTKFMARQNWNVKSYRLPSEQFKRKGRDVYDPKIELCRNLLYQTD